MAKKALVIGVDPYPAPADDLHAAAKEAANWERILSAEFGFDRVTLVTDRNATRARVLQELRTLFGAATGTDDIVVYFGGHGAKARGWESDSETNEESEHALIVYAGENPVTSFQHAAVTPSDFARILKEKRPPNTVRIALVIDCCFAERFNPIYPFHDAEPPVRPQVLFIPNAVPGLPATEPLTFNAIAAMVDDRTIADPIVLGASRFDQPAHEVGPDNNRRLLFSAKLQDLVEKAFAARAATPTYAGAIYTINPLSELQCAVVAGNHLLDDKDFAGGFAQVISNPAPSAEVLASSITAVGSLHIRLLGLLTLIDLPAERAPYRSRIIAAVDNQAQTAADIHFAFIEVADRDMYQRPTVDPTDEYVRAGIKYSRWRLNQHRVTILNVADSGTAVARSATFQKHVPSLPKVSPGLDPNMPRMEARAATLANNLFQVFFDLQCGDANVDVRDLETHTTHFRGRVTNVKTWGPERTPISTMLTVPLENAYAIIVLENVKTGKQTILFVNSGATILFGNARELDINGPGSGEGPRTHFLIYYQLAPSEPVDAGLPETVQVPINACTMTGWP